ncbi:hypothetical protein [uncultured Oscillibacter sp.]|uniref:hypothetical protein n=1 Tax=uncultured Oscillibacter sp. TaxID=876091 RepID=UPI0025FC5F5C|nr:hypothetical protein [uncultured Oscillibacter sp.]
MRGRNSLLLRGAKRLNWGAMVSGAGFLLYLGAAALGWEGTAEILSLVFVAVSLYVFASVAAARRRDKEAVSYNLLWGQGALTLLLCMCAALTVRKWLGR